MHKYLFLLLLCAVFLSSCANYKLNYAPGEEAWETKNPLPSEDTLQLVYSVYLLGDAGNSPPNEVVAGVRYFNKMLAEAPENSAAILLGDNIYPKGLPPVWHETRAISEHRLNVQLEGLKHFKGRPLIVLGNHDWGFDGIDAARRQQLYVEEYLERDSVVLPHAGCGGPALVELGENLVVIMIDSQWWIEDWDNFPDINAGCPVNSREMLINYFEDILTDHVGKNIIVAMHHPPYTNGPHGGYFTLRHHLFPLMDKHVYIPIPILGSLVNWVRGSVGTETDVAFPRYVDLRDQLANIAEANDSVIFVSGHEHNLQMFKIDNQTYIVSGSGSKMSPVLGGNGAIFTYGGNYGFVVLKIYENGAVYSEFYEPIGDGEEGRLIYRKKIKDNLPQLEEPKFQPFEIFQTQVKTLEAAVYPDSVEIIELDKALWGSLHRDLYRQRVEVPVLYLNRAKGGLTVKRPGGSKKAYSLRLEDKDGRAYVLRSLRKDAKKALPKDFNFKLNEELVEHFFAASNPYAVFTIPPLAKAINVHHTNPALYFLPRQPALGKFNRQYANQLYMLVEYPDQGWSGYDDFGNAKKIVNYRQIFMDINEENEKPVVVNQRMALRQRLLDLLIGDWDRHLDQWRFAKKDMGDHYLYEPIARDRDMAYAQFDGVVHSIGKLTSPFLKATMDFEEKIDEIKWFNFQGHAFDRAFLNQLSWTDWNEEITYMQRQLTDEVIEEAIKKLPPPIFERVGPQIIQKLKIRRNNLKKDGRKFYELNAGIVDIIGSDNPDLFTINRLENGNTQVKVYMIKRYGNEDYLKYERTFYHGETKEIRLYGLDKTDRFVFYGKAKKGIKIRAVGGLGDDEYVDESFVKGFRHKTKIYDTETGNKVQPSKETNVNFTSLTDFNSWRSLKYDYNFNYSVPYPSFGYNNDDGVFLGMNLSRYTFPFKRENVQKLDAQYAFDTRAWTFDYLGDFDHVYNDKWDLLVRAKILGPNYVRNFFGLGNETEQQVADIDYYRVRQNLIGVSATLKNEIFQKNYFGIGLSGEASRLDQTPENITSNGASEFPARLFDYSYYAGIHTELHFSYLNDAVNPTSGIRFDTRLGWKSNLELVQKNFAEITTDLTFYYGWWGKPQRVWLASRIGWHQLIGNYEFWQAATLGGEENLRGYRRDRFSGKASFYHNNDVRIRLGAWRNRLLPMTIGVLGGFDYGRIFLAGEKSRVWHYGYGGGIWASPLELFIFQGSYFASPEDRRFILKAGFQF